MGTVTWKYQNSLEKVKEGRRMTEKEVEKAYKKMTEPMQSGPVGKD